MTVRALSLLALVLLETACAGRGTRRAGGPPPEYERPEVPEWDAGKPVDPLEQAIAAGEPVDDQPTLVAPDGAAGSDSGADAGVR